MFLIITEIDYSGVGGADFAPDWPSVQRHFQTLLQTNRYTLYIFQRGEGSFQRVMFVGGDHIPDYEDVIWEAVDALQAE